MLKKIDKSSPLPKYYQICDSIKEKIACGEFSTGSKIPTCRELMEYFNTTVVTISSAMRQLEDDGYISKVQGKGMFVLKRETVNRKSKNPKYKQIGLLMPTKEDVFQNITSALIARLESKNYYITPLATTSDFDNMSNAELEQRIAKYVDDDFDAFVIHGSQHFPYKLLHKYKEKIRQLNFIVNNESAIEFPEANEILFNNFEVGYIAARYLLESGRKRIAMLGVDIKDAAIIRRNGSRAETHDGRIATGIKQALNEAGLDPARNFSLIHDTMGNNKTSEDLILEFIQPGDCGIFAVGDWRALKVYHAAKKIRLKINDDIGVVGLYNTPWTEIITPALTSISINEDEIARITAECISCELKGQKFMVAPQLVKRES
ncbi:MAG: substrate-binding domain-containing protein [Victivallaceae bacterium]|jgi:DNA-binding LacI/PurR family transcriptional regulator